MFRGYIKFLFILIARPLGLRTTSANDARANGVAFFNRKARARNGTKPKSATRYLNAHVVKPFGGKLGFKLSLFGKILFVSSLLYGYLLEIKI